MIDQERVLRTFLDYVRIDSETHHEGAMTERLAADLRALGLEVCTDQAGKAPGVDSDGANVYGFLEGDAGHDSILFSAHMDTVTPGRGIEPIIEGGYVRTRGDTVLGADDKSGVAAIMEALRCLVESGAPHRPVEVVFTIREEGGSSARPTWSMTASAPNTAWCWMPAMTWARSSPALRGRFGCMPTSTESAPTPAPIRRRASAPSRQPPWLSAG